MIALKKNETVSFIVTIVAAVLIALFVRTFIFNIAVVNGESMNPTLNEKDKLICLSYKRFTDIPRGQIVVIDAPNDNRNYIKRLVGKPGDTIEFRDGKVILNGKILEENYTSSDYTESNVDAFKLKDDEYFVMGDNRLPGMSIDSRYFGPIEKKRIKSAAVYRILPLNNRGKI
ncbi:signal peptidase I [Peptoniphilus phoceensis]|uniref:signal peptidase I n=1 Tax=Peptoniphilus phoceensis TaxID=1720298 RepID=UPI001E604A0E|nr:signal peptidase I [Peptoniphilus phoceensis]